MNRSVVHVRVRENAGPQRGGPPRLGRTTSSTVCRTLGSTAGSVVVGGRPVSDSNRAGRLHVLPVRVELESTYTRPPSITTPTGSSTSGVIRVAPHTVSSEAATTSTVVA